jgi:hypothetical protein
MVESKYEIEKTNDRGYVLWIDEKPSICPFTPSIMVPGQIPGTASMMRMPCSTQCPSAKVAQAIQPGTSDVGLNYITSCGHNDNWKAVTEKEIPKQQNQSGILKTI